MDYLTRLPDDCVEYIYDILRRVTSAERIQAAWRGHRVRSVRRLYAQVGRLWHVRRFSPTFAIFFQRTTHQWSQTPLRHGL